MTLLVGVAGRDRGCVCVRASLSVRMCVPCACAQACIQSCCIQSIHPPIQAEAEVGSMLPSPRVREARRVEAAAMAAAGRGRNLRLGLPGPERPGSGPGGRGGGRLDVRREA